MNLVEIFDSVLEGGRPPVPVAESMRGLAGVAQEVAEAIAAVRLSPADQERLYARSMAMLEHAIDEHRRGWQRVLHLERPAPAIVGGAALTLGAAAIGWALIHGRHASSRPAAA